MIFGRVEAFVSALDEGKLHLRVLLESGRSVRTVRDDIVPVLRPVTGFADLAWHADQYAQETIGNELALEGWEVIAAGEIPESDGDSLPRSASYAIRRIGEPSW